MPMNSGQGSFMLGIKSVLQFILNAIAGLKKESLPRRETGPPFTFPISHLKKTALCMLWEHNYHQRRRKQTFIALTAASL